MPLQIFTFFRFCPPPLNSPPSVSHDLQDDGYNFDGYFIHFQIFYYPSLRNNIIGLFEVSQCHGYIFRPRFDFFEDRLVYIYLVICFFHFPMVSFLLFRKKYAAYEQLIDFFSYLSSEDFPHQR